MYIVHDVDSICYVVYVRYMLSLPALDIALNPEPAWTLAQGIEVLVVNPMHPMRPRAPSSPASF